jgi:predicted secreted Zn-dependent protease
MCAKDLPMRRILALVAALAAATPLGAQAASLSKTYSYFAVTGKSAEQLENSMLKRGPKVGNSRSGHPGATKLTFSGGVKYDETKRGCRVASASYHVKANVILPLWRNRHKGDESLVFVWDTLSQDIRRHEESHIVIAKNHARMIEDKARALPAAADCKVLQKKVDALTEAILAKHDAAQQQFDRIEASSFERRILRLLAYRMSREPPAQ